MIRQQTSIQKQSDNQHQHQFQCQIFAPSDIQYCTQQLTKVFSKIQLMTSLNIPYQGLVHFMRQIIIVGLKRNLSTIVRDTVSKRIAGCSISFDLRDQNLVNFSMFDKEIFSPLFQILEESGHQFLHYKHAFDQEPGNWVHVWLVGVFEGFQGNKLTRKMLDYNTKLHQLKGYKHSVVQLVNQFTQQTYLNSSEYYKAVKEVKFSQFLHHGNKVMPNAKGNVTFGYCDLQNLKLNKLLINN